MITGTLSLGAFLNGQFGRSLPLLLSGKFSSTKTIHLIIVIMTFYFQIHFYSNSQCKPVVKTHKYNMDSYRQVAKLGWPYGDLMPFPPPPGFPVSEKTFKREWWCFPNSIVPFLYLQIYVIKPHFVNFKTNMSCFNTFKPLDMYIYIPRQDISQSV